VAKKKPEWLMRTVSVPVRFWPSDVGGDGRLVLDDKGEPVPTHTRQQMWAACGEAWKLSTELANWAGRELLRADVSPPHPGKLPAMPKVYLYGLLTPLLKERWAGQLASANCVLRAVERAYRAKRFEVQARCSAAPAAFRYPYPFRVHNQIWSVHVPADAEMNAGEHPVCTLTLPGIGRVHLPLSRASGHRRALALLRRIAAGDPTVKKGELTVTRQRDGDRNGGHGTDGGPDRAKRAWTIMLRFSVGTRPAENDGTQTMNLVTDPEALLVCWLVGRKDWVVNDDHVRRRIAAHAARRQRLSQDRKAERRLRRGVGIQARLDLECEKHERFMDTYLHQTAAAVAGYAVRNRVGCVFADLSPSGYVDSFPWFKLRERIGNRLAREGVELVDDKWAGSNETSTPEED
jgi:hypothetical protein